ncbi:hypothetical protein DYQ86_10300 [Acidobacteria bacterium AB60]|nr:hypothetical protein DYQ86_10300 [Acidobacteria bacterium AB60]
MRPAWIAAALLVCTSLAEARITRVVVVKTEPHTLVTGYQRITGVAHGELDPHDAHNAVITDLALAPRNAKGMVEYAATFTLQIPEDMARASGFLLYEVVNRGRSLARNSYEGGDIYLTSGWQGDIPWSGEALNAMHLETIRVPVAHNADGSSITGPILARFLNIAPGQNTVAVGTAAGYVTSGPPPAPVDLNTAHGGLVSRQWEGMNGAHGADVVIPAEEWAWADCSAEAFPGKPDAEHICVKGGFDPDRLYQLTYTGKDPLVLGIGFAAMRDLNAFFRYAAKDDEGWANPLAGQVRHAIGRGASQSGNTLRTFLNLGFNQAEDGRQVWDGVFPTIAARQVPLNVRFGIPGGASGLYEVGSDGVVWWTDWEDPVRHHAKDGLLHRCTATATCPKIFELLGSTEFWLLRASADFVGTDDAADLPLPPNVRRYYIASTEHGGGRGGFFTSAPAPAAGQPSRASSNPIQGGPCAYPRNPNPEWEIYNALLADLKEWVAEGKEPPPSSYPRVAAHELVPASAEAMGYPQTAVLPDPDGMVNPLLVYDLGPGFRDNDLSGSLATQPPRVMTVIPPLVPRVDVDGNEVGGVHTVQQDAALGTYLGWNVTTAGFAKGQLCSLAGSFIPFAATRAEREANGDPRLSLEERYGDLDGFVCAVHRAAQRLIERRLLLKGDAERIEGDAARSQVLSAAANSSAAARAVAQKVCAAGR